MAVPKTVPCRLYGLLAREAPVGVIFRRGPSKWIQIIRWDTATDEFTPGQWFHGRIYERRGDLSPDGKLLVYFAQKINRHTIESDYGYVWTAISRPPYLTALALWPGSWGTYGGGGVFLSNREVFINQGEHCRAHPNHPPRGLLVTHGGGGGEDEPIQSVRLHKNGWRYSEDGGFERRQKQNPHGWQKLQCRVHGWSSSWVETFSVRYAEGADWPLKGAEWADWDQQGRLVFAREGKLFALPADRIGHDEPQELIDLNPFRPERMEAPDWAKQW